MRQLLLGWILITGLLGAPMAIASDADLLKKADFPAKLAANSPALERKNEAILTYLWADVYAAAFYAQPNVTARQAFAAQSAQKLELYYFREIDRSDVIKAANNTLEQQQSKEVLARLRPEIDRLHNSYQNIKPGDRYDLSWDDMDGLTLALNRKIVFASPDRELAKAYFGLWLAPDGLSDTLRKSLLQ